MSRRCFEYDPESDSWSPHRFALSTGRGDGAAVRMSEDEWWVTGGMAEPDYTEATASTELYRVGSGFGPGPVDLPLPLEEHCLVKVNDTHYFLSNGWPLENGGDRAWILDLTQDEAGHRVDCKMFLKMLIELLPCRACG